MFSCFFKTCVNVKTAHVGECDDKSDECDSDDSDLSSPYNLGL
jgi:hypothetical protein